MLPKYELVKLTGKQCIYTPRQYCASCNKGVMPILPFNTVPNIGILLACYRRSTGAVFFGSTGETLK